MADNINLFGRIGKAWSALGSHQQVRMSRHHEIVVSEGSGKYHEGAESGEIFTASVAVTGVAPGTALSTTPPFALWNSTGSGKKISILKVTAGYVSGTLGAGSLVYAQVTDAAAPAGGTTITPVAAELGSSSIGTAAVRTGSTVDATPTLLRPSGIVFGATLATSAVSYAPWVDHVDGEFQLQEGETFVVEGVAAAGTSPVIIIAVTYQELQNA